MAEGTWFKSMTKDNFLFVILFLACNIVISIMIKWLNKGDDSMKKIIGSILEVLQSFTISFVAGSTLSLR